ncbi:multiple epidermal growth factor-like domains protein 10 [Saccostrea cucullata]|uniref:multiple epidermal growth factor-like domains protein 10 n=1 Tax=Saccostrea cuccullata TaxID=36930 RepID=UPI002ED337D0
MFRTGQKICSDNRSIGDNKNDCGCKTGYQGSNCSLPCRFPSYGDFCQSGCECEERFCNHILGCTKECEFGYNGTNCSLVCVYPFYGDQCMQSCNCDKELCNNALGCIDGMPLQSTKIIIGVLSVCAMFIIIGFVVVIRIIIKRFSERRRNSPQIGSATPDYSWDLYRPYTYYDKQCCTQDLQPTDNGIYMLAYANKYETIDMRSHSTMEYSS